MDYLEGLMALQPAQEFSFSGLGDSNYRVLICLLGNFRLLKAGQSAALICGGKTEKLLCLLALRHGRRVPREVVLDTLWPDGDSIHASQSLNSLIYSVNKLIGVRSAGLPRVASKRLLLAECRGRDKRGC